MMPPLSDCVLGCSINADDEAWVVYRQFLDHHYNARKPWLFEKVLQSLGQSVKKQSSEYLFAAVATSIKSKNSTSLSIDDIAATITSGTEISDKIKTAAQLRQAIFAILGLLTMLYLPCQSSSEAVSSQLCILQPQPPIVESKQVPETNCSRGILTLLRKFGQVIPKPGQKDHASEALYPSQLNYFSLSRISNVQIKWVDTLSQHLHFDASTKELMLFRLPSFCILHSRKKASGSVLNSLLAGLKVETSSALLTPALLHEILLSYRIIFGQDKKSRKLYWAKEKAAAVIGGIDDPFLDRLCGRKKHKLDEGDFILPFSVRNVYGIKDDFPVLGERFLRLQSYNMRTSATSLRDFWNDRRNPFNFYTFWAVLVVGFISILLSIVQCGLSLAQVIIAAREK